MTAEERRQQLIGQVVAVLADHRVTVTPTTDGGMRLHVTPHADVAALLLPLFEQVAVDAAAKELESWERTLRIASRASLSRRARAVYADVAVTLGLAAVETRARAAELRAPARTDEEN